MMINHVVRETGDVQGDTLNDKDPRKTGQPRNHEFYFIRELVLVMGQVVQKVPSTSQSAKTFKKSPGEV